MKVLHSLKSIAIVCDCSDSAGPEDDIALLKDPRLARSEDRPGFMPLDDVVRPTYF